MGHWPQHLPASPAQHSQAATASLLQPSTDNLGLSLQRGESPAEKQGQRMAPQSLSRVVGKPLLFPRNLTGVRLYPSSHPTKLPWPRFFTSVSLLLLSKPWHSWKIFCLTSCHFDGKNLSSKMLLPAVLSTYSLWYRNVLLQKDFS